VKRELMPDAAVGSTATRRPRPGDVVEVRPPAEILATLDENGELDAVPFMPEMLRHAGRRYTVSKRVEKICDTVAGAGSRRMQDTVYLEDLRCDGSAHGGCQAGCRLYWKESWLRPVDETREDPATDDEAREQLAALASAGTQTVRTLNGEPVEVYRCQATEALRATTPLRTSDPGQYVRELRSRNVGILRFARVAVRALSGAVVHRLGIRGTLPMNLGGEEGRRDELGLQPGDWVRIKSPEEIGRTLDANGRNRGLLFTAEMIPHCGKRFRVRQRVKKIIDEPTGRLITFGTECVVLDGPVCTGDHTPGRWFCPRDAYPFWREAWLERVEPPNASPRARALARLRSR
jgi:hypothetical protein